ncbi:MAG: ketol-acid reductoisomerase [Candidatus Krumholzibacteriia bacterium]
MSTRFFPGYPPGEGSVIEPEAVDLGPLAGRCVTVIGYGTMGRAMALNLRRSGVRVLVGAREGSPRRDLALAEGLEVSDPARATARGDVVMLLLPDEAMAGVFARDIAPHLQPDAALGFAHGFAVAFGQIDPGPARDCFLAAPKGQGDMLLAAHAAGGGVPGLLAVTGTSRPETWDLAAAYAKAVGCLAGGGFVTTFRQECVSDQFGEQVVLCGGVLELLKAAFAVMVEAGYGEQNAYFECIHELKLITDLVHRQGIDGMRGRISGTAAYGGLTRGPRLIGDEVRRTMVEILAEIETGAFAREFLARHDDPVAGTRALAAREAAGPLAVTGRSLLHRLHRAAGADDAPAAAPDPEPRK